MMVVPILCIVVAMKCCAPFLSLNNPVPADVLVVEGWLPDYALKDAVAEFQRGHYRYIITAGSPLLEGYYLSELKTSADMAAAALVRFGMPTNLVVAVPGPAVLRERSLAHARAVAAWLEKNDPKVQSLNVYSIGVHTRRTRLVFEQVLGGRIQVGAISHQDAAYDINHWWRSSQGFRTVTEEALAFVWTRVCGRP